VARLILRIHPPSFSCPYKLLLYGPQSPSRLDRIPYLKRPLPLLLISLALSSTASATISESHGYAQFGTLKYPARFTHFDWVNPQAPKGGTLRVMAFGTFDTLNPYTFKGTSPVTTPSFLQYGINELNEPLMVGTGQYAPSGDEPASSYGLIAQSVEYNENRSWVVFNLRPEARFHDGTPITAYDVAFSYRVLLKEGHPLYRTSLQEVSRVDILNPQRIRFVFKRAGNPLLILRLGEMPPLSSRRWAAGRIASPRSRQDDRSSSNGSRTTGARTCRSIAASTTSTAWKSSSTATASWRSRRSRPVNSTSISSTRRRTGTPATTSPPYAAAR
jgi:microcin C transport system substrate-binding protein